MNTKVNTWECSNCDHLWQFSGEAAGVSPYDLSEDQLKQQFPTLHLSGIQSGKCPVCYHRGESGVLGLSVDPNKMSSVIVATDAELEAREVEDLDANGQPIMEETGEFTERVGIVDGQIAVIQEPVYAPKMRPLTEDELAALKLQRDQSLDALEAVAVNEINGEA